MKIRFTWGVWALTMMFLTVLLIGGLQIKRTNEGYETLIVPRTEKEAEMFREQVRLDMELREDQRKAHAEASDLISIIRREREKREAAAEKATRNAMWVEGDISCDEFVAKVEAFCPQNESGEVLSTQAGYNCFFRQNAKDFYYISVQHGLNPMYVFALGLVESYYGSSQLAVENRNLFGIGAYDEAPEPETYPCVASGIREVCNTLEAYASPGTWEYAKIVERGGCPTSIGGQSLLYSSNPQKGEQLLELMEEIFS